MPPTLTGLLIGFGLIGLLMLVMERIWPGVRGQRIFRRGFWLDLLYWFFTPLVTHAISRGVTIVVVVLVLFAIGAKIDKASAMRLIDGHGPLAEQSKLAQALEMLVLLDFTGYWLHRWFHGRRLWPFHAIHHSSEDLDWLSSVRLHPVNDVVTRSIQAFVVLMLGFSPVVLAGALPALTLHAILLHANVNWDFGPFRRIISSPVFHRWHHTSAEEGRDKNFAGLLPVWDTLFGTYYMPGYAPRQFGVTEPVPRTIWGQLMWPFRRREAGLVRAPLAGE